MNAQIQDELMLHQLFKQLAGAWNAGDAALYASYFTGNCDYVTFAGDHLAGREANEKAHHALFNGILKGSVLNSQIEKIHFLCSDIAIVHCTGNVRLRWQKKNNIKRQSINTNVVVKQQGEWKVAAFHNCRIRKANPLQKLAMSLFAK